MMALFVKDFAGVCLMQCTASMKHIAATLHF